MAENQRLQQIYDALKQDGQFSQTKDYDTFAKKMNERGYSSMIWKNLKQAGADVGKNPWEMRRWLGIQEFAPKPKQTASQPGKVQTAAQMAQQMFQPQQQVKADEPNDYISRTSSGKSKAQNAAPKNASPLVQGLYRADDAIKANNANIDYSSPKAAKQMLGDNEAIRKLHSNDAADRIVNDERRRRNQPIVKTNTPADDYVVKTEGQLEEDMRDSAKQMVDADMGSYLDKVISDEFKNAHARGLAARSAAGGGFTRGTAGADWWIAERAYQEQMDPQKMLEEVTGNVQRNIEATFSNPKVRQRVLDDAARLGVDPEQYLTQYVTPALVEKAGDQFYETQLNRMMPAGSVDYIIRGILNSLTGTVLTGLITTKGQRQMLQQADAMTEEGLNPNFQPGIIDKAAKGAVGFMADAPSFGVAGKVGGAVAGRVLGNGVAQAARLANMSKWQRAVYMAKTGAVSQGVTGILYGSTNAVAQNLSTGEDNSIGTNLKLALKGGISEGASFATMGAIGGAVGGLGYGIGINGAESYAGQRMLHAGQKVGYEAFKVVSEGIGMHLGGQVANLIENGEFDVSIAGTIEDVANVVALKLTHIPKLNRMHGKDGKKESFGSAIARNFASFITSGAAKNSAWKLSSDDKDALMASGDLKSVNATDIKSLSKSYEKIMADPNVSWDAKAKYSAMVMGVMPSSRPMGDYHTFTFEKVGDKTGYKKYINEYAADGTLLSKRSYDTADERGNVLYEDTVLRETARMSNAFALSVNADTSNRDLQAEFLRSKGFDESKPLDYHVNATLTAGMNDHESAIYQEFIDYAANHGETARIVDAVAAQNGMSKAELIKAFQDKEPLKRTDAEQNACVELRRALEKSVFKEGEVHEEQSHLEGKDVAEDNNLGTEQPNGDAVKQELNNLTEAENALEQLIKDNEVFGQNFESLQKKGYTNPQIYQWMMDNGLTQEQLEPFAHYINANARVQGMQTATQQKIEEKVSAYVQDWSLHGTLNGQEANGEQVVWVQDKEGRTLVVGSGEMAFDTTNGRAKEGVGDMLICLDPNTGEMVYVKAEDTTLFQTQKPEDFGNEYRQKLQQINSQAYNEAAQEQAIMDETSNGERGAKNESSSTDAASASVPTSKSSISGEQSGSASHPNDVSVGKGTEKNPSGQENPIINDGNGGTDINGNIRNSDGSVYTEPVKTINDITDNDFNEPTRSVELPPVPKNVSTALGANGKPIIIKKNIFEKNLTHHAELEPEDSRAILENALYNPNLIGQTQPIKRPSYKVAVQTGDKNSIVVLDVYNDKKQVEIIGWRLINEKGLAKMKRQAEREGGQFLILSPKDGSAAALSALPHGLSSDGKDTNNSSNGNASEATLTFENGEKVPVDANGEPDFMQMTPEQGAEVYKMLFEEDAPKQIDEDIKALETDLKQVRKTKFEGKTMMEKAASRKKVKEAIALAEEQVEKAKAIKKAMTAQKVAETMKPKEEAPADGAHEAGSVAAQKFKSAPRLTGNTRTRTLTDKTKVKGHYEIVPAESLTPSHDVYNGYKKSEGFPVDSEGRTINDRDYEHDKAAQQDTDQKAMKYDGQAIDYVPTVSDEGIVYDGNGRTMAGQKAAKEGTDAEYIDALLENAENFGFTREQIEQSGIEHPRLVMVTDERLPYDTATFAKFNRNEKKTQSNTEKAVAKAKTLTADEVGAIVAEIDGHGSLDAFFGNSKAINDLINTLIKKGVIGQNEVAEMKEGEDKLSAQGKEYVKNLLLGSIFKPETIRMLGVDPTVKNKAINAIRSVMDNMKLGDYSLREEIDQAVQLLYEARQGNNQVDTLLRQQEMFGENAANRYPSISQMMALALEGKVSDFRDLLNEYNRIATARNTGEGDMFAEKPTKEELVNEYLKFKNWQDYETRHSERERGNDVPGTEKPQQEASGGNEPAEEEPQVKVNKALKALATEITKDTGIEVVTDDKVSQSTLDEAEATDANIKFHKETNPDVLDELNSGKTIKVYRAMQVIDGKLYPPMAASVDGKLVEANELGQWIRADENPDLAIPDIDPKTGEQKVDKKTGELKWKFKLDKGGKDATGKKATDVNAAYNPYWHMSRSPLNDQFKSAWIRPNIVVVECEVPVSELTSGYKAERAKDAVGEVDWKSGSVSGEVFKQTGRARKVILSRWCKPVRVLDDAEVAQRAKEFVGEAKVEIPENVLTPKQRIAFEEAGFKIGAPEKGVKKSEQILEALKRGLQIDNTVREQREAGGAVLDWGNVPSKARLANDELTSIIMQNNRAYIDELDKLGEGETIEHYVDANGYFYTFRVDKNHHIYMDEAIPKTSSASKERINELKNYYNAERARHLETIRSDRGETQSELGRPTDSDGSTVRRRNSQDSAVGGGSERAYSEGNVERDSSRPEQYSSRIKEFRSKNGEVYGFTVDGKIYLDTEKMKPETPLHEYTHLWTAALKRANPKEWESVKKLFDEVEGLKEEVQKLYPELKGDDLYEEMITTYSGREGTKKLEEVVRGLAAKDGKTVEESSKAQGFLEKVKTALQKYWKGVADMLHIHFTSAEEVADKVLADWAKGMNSNEVKEEKDEIARRGEEKPKQGADKSVIKGEKWNATGEPEKFKASKKKHADSHDVLWTIGNKSYGSTTGERDTIDALLEEYKEYAPLWNAYEKGEVLLSPNEAAILKAAIIESENNAGKGSIQDRKKSLIEKMESGTIKTKNEAWVVVTQAKMLLAEHQGLVYDEDNGYITKSPTITEILRRAKNILDRITDEPVESATEKQTNYINKLIAPSNRNYYDVWVKERAALEGMAYNKRQASKLIDRIKFLNDINTGYTEQDITGAENDIHKLIDLIRERNGAKPYDWKGITVLPKDGKPDPKFDPFGAAAEDYKKEHPMTEEEIMAVEGLDDEAKYTAIDYLNGEDDSEIARICYEQAYNKRKPMKAKSAKVEKPEAPVAPEEGAGEGGKPEDQKDATQPTTPPSEQKPKTAAQKKADAKKFKEERDKETSDLMQQFLDAAKERDDDGSGKLFSLPVPIPSKALQWMDKHLTLTEKQKEILPKLLTAIKGSMYARIKEGVYNLEDVIERVRDDFNTFFSAISQDDANKILAEAAYKGKYTDPETGERKKLSEYAEDYKKQTPEHKANLVGDSTEAEDRKQNEKHFINSVKTVLSLGGFKNGIVGLRKIAESSGLKGVKDTDLQELAETAIVEKARAIATSAATSTKEKFDRIKKLYERQPSLNQRDSERVIKQQYSTPAPYAFLASMYVKGDGKEIKSALEPSAGNGMLTIGLPKEVVHVNDIDAQRLANLRRQGFENVTSQDGTQPFADKDVDVVITNPPFGTVPPKDYDGYKISSLEGQMAINALESMKDNGRAAIIIGGKTEYAKNGSLNPKDKAFLGYLYSHYNVEDVINVDGSLFAKQGTTFPTRIILINGRRYDENTFPPVKDKARAETVKDYDELYKRISDDLLRSRRMDSSIGEGEKGPRPEFDKPSTADTHEEGLRAGKPRGGERKATDGLGGVSDKPSIRVPDNELGDGRGAERESDGGFHNGASGTDRAGAEPTQSEGRGDNSNRHGVGGRVHQPEGVGRTSTEHSSDGSSSVLKPTQKRSLSSEKVDYAPKSGNPFTLQSVMPADQQEAVNKNLEKLGDADRFLVDELGYSDKDDLYAHLAAEQIDSVALALQQAKKGNAFIIGDMTGIGKGRQAASLIRYAKKQGQIPIYFTKTAGLLSDVYRDLVDVGSPDLRPFVFGSSTEAKITDSDGKVVYKLPTDKEKERVLAYIDKYGKLPKEYDYVLTTYSQVSNGIYEFDENGARKERKLKKGDSFSASAFSGQERRDAIEKLMDNGYLILDESHTAGGDSGQGNYFQHIIQKAKNVTFFSATFAKRPDNMPIYALRTAMNQGGLKASELIDAVKRGGATLQEIMSQTLTQCGQMIRRERDMTGVTIDWKPIEDPVVISEQREQYDKTIELFNDIINFQRTYVNPYIEGRNKELAAMQASIGIKRGTKDLGIASTPFASKAFNTVQQVLLSLKAKEAANRAIGYLKQGVKPVIALNNTNESQSGEIKENVEVEEPDLGTSLKKGLAGTLRYTKKNAKNDSEFGLIDIASLGDDAINAYNELMKKIENASTGLALSPIDVIKNELQKAGYKVGELTGRKTEFIYNDNGTVSKVKRTDTDKKKLAREFNEGSLDALILNKSASTGISLHASSKFRDQRKRVMIVAQQQLDVNDEVQMRGRIDRTGQVTRGAYEYIVSQIPAEQRLLMMFKAKLKSLDANTTSSQKSKFNEMEVSDITNKYGDKVVKEYMAEHLDLYSRMADPFNWEKDGVDLRSVDPQKLINSKGGKNYEDGQSASKLLGRMALLKVSEQETMLKEIGELYAAEIQRLNEMGENDLVITELPLKAKTISKEVWKKGTEPGGDNAFADNTYIEKVNMAILKKPMKAEEVSKAQNGLTGGKSWTEYRDEKKASVKSYFDEKIENETQRYEERAVKLATKAKEKYIKDAKRGQKDSGMSDEQIEKMAGYQYDEIYKQEKEKLNDVIKNLKAKAGMFDRILDTFDTEDAYVLPVDMNNPNEISGFGNSYGRLIDIKFTDNFSPNASSVSFATLDGRRKITFPVTGKVGAGDKKADIIAAIARMTRQASAVGDKHLRVLSMDVSNWDRLVSNESRKDGYIITGNLMQALIDTKDQGVGGQLVKYTTEDGKVNTGILMPDRFEPKSLSNKVPISAKAEALLKPFSSGIKTVTSSDGNVKVTYQPDYYYGRPYYELRVPKSNAKGSKYFLDKKLLDMVSDNNFETKGNSMVAKVSNEALQPVLSRLSDLGVTVMEERKTSDSGTHFREDREGSNNASSPVESHIANVAKKVGGKVKMVSSVDEITNANAKAAIEAGKPVTGWYDEVTGEVHLYMPNIHDRYTAEKTIWHEVVGHKGMRELLGDNYDKFLREVWDSLDKPENADLKKLVDKERKFNPFNVYDNIEEGIARLAEEGRGEPGFWRNIKNKITDFLHEIGYRVAPNTKDVKYLLWLSKNLQKNPNDPYWKLRAEAVKYRLDHEDVPSVVGKDGMFHDNTGHTYHDLSDLPKAEYQAMTDGTVHFRTTPSAGTAIDRYHRALNAHGYMATESFMDNMLSLKELMKAVDPSIKKIEDVKSSENPYILQNTMQGAMSDAADMFERNVMKPLDKAMADVLDAFEGKKDEAKIRNFNLYMITKHGLERNRVFFVRDYVNKLRKDEDTKQDADILQKQWDAEKKDLGDKLRNGSIDLREYYDQMDEWIRNNVSKNFDASEHDYSGMHGLQQIADNKAPYNDAAAIQDVMDAEASMEGVKAGSVKDFWSKVNAATSYSLYCDYKNGFQNKETYDKTSQMFDWYVPLRKFDEATAEDVYGYVTEKGDPSGYIGSVLMSAKGRKSLSEVNVLAQIGAMGNMAISNGGKNAVKQAFMRFARSRDSQGLITEGEVWLVKDGTNADGSDRWVESYPQIPDNATPDDVSNIVSQFEANMKAKRATGDAKVMRNSADIGYKFERAKDKSQHAVDVKVNGKTHRFYINGNPRAAQALNGMLENKGSKYLKPLSSITRTMAQLCTSYSPEFVIRNIVRDMQFASSNVTAKEGAKYGAKWGEYYAKMIPIGVGNIRIGDIKGSEGVGLYAKYRNGKLDMSNKIHRYFKEFMENGGETGWVQVMSMKEWEKKYKRDIKAERSKVDKGGKAIKDFFFGNLENLNEAAENMARFATYCTSRDYGRSAVRSAYDAKEVSTNFNRHGSGDAVWSFKNGEIGDFKKARRNTYGFIASYLRQCSMFFNAGIQSTNLLKQNFKAAPKGTITAMMAMPFALGVGAALLNNWMIANEDEDERNGVKDPYAELPDYIRRNDLCIYKGGGEFITIPLAIELRAFYGLGDLAVGMTFAKNIQSTRAPWMDAVGCVSQLVPIMDYTNSHAVDKDPIDETLKAFSPSALSPFVEWGLNSDWKGAPIRRETTSYNEYAPAWQRAYKNTPETFMSLNKKVNAATNDVAPGNEDMLGNGFLDAATNPAGLNHYLGGFGGGAATFGTRAAKLITSDKVETNDMPFLRSFLYKPNEQSSMQRTKSKWYNYVDSMEKTMSNVDRLKTKNVPIDKRLENVAYYYKFKDSNEAQKADIVERAQKYMKKWKQMRDRSSDATAIDNANKNIDLIMQQAVEQLDKLN